MALQAELVLDNPEGADLCGKVVEVMKAGVVTVTAEVLCPGSKDEELPPCAGIEALTLGFPQHSDGLLLEVDKGEAATDALTLDELLTARDAGGHEGQPHKSLGDEGIGSICEGLSGLKGDGGLGAHIGSTGVAVALALLGGQHADGSLSVAHHLVFLRDLEEHEVAVGGVTLPCYGEAEGALHNIGKTLADKQAVRVLLYIDLPVLELAVLAEDAVVEARGEEGRSALYVRSRRLGAGTAPSAGVYRARRAGTATCGLLR